MRVDVRIHASCSANDSLEDQFVLLRHFTVAALVLVLSRRRIETLAVMVSRVQGSGRVREAIGRATD